MRDLARAIALLLLLQPGGTARAQSIEDCMRAPPAEAVAICETLIESGRADAAVHAQLALSLDKDGRSADARRAIERALGRYPGDRDLLDLRERLDASTSERERLERAAARNESAVSQGMLRLRCLTRDGDEGIDACRTHLALTDVDGERLRERLAVLERELAPDAIEVPTVPDPLPDPLPDPIDEPPPSVTAPAPLPPTTPAPPPPTDADAERRTLVADVQRALNALGLDAGRPDGVAGRRTYDALTRFGERVGAGAPLAIGRTTLERLEGARAAYDEALRRLDASRAASDAGDLDEGLLQLGRAESASPLFEAPPGYRAGLESARDAERRRAAEEDRRLALEAAPAPVSEPDPPPVAAPVELPAPPVAESDDASDDAAAALMMRIGQLERALADAADERRREEARLRELVGRTLAGEGR